MSVGKISRDKSLSSFSEKVYKLWPWLKQVSPRISAQDLDNYYEMTYAFGDEKWEDRLKDGTDEDESQRGIFVFLICLEFGFDGSKPSRPSLWEFWRQLHKQVICPCFKDGKGEEVMMRYISWPAKSFDLDEGLLRVIWHKVYDTAESTVEEDWISEHFHAWMMADRKQFLANVKKQYAPDEKTNHSSERNKERESKKEEKTDIRPPATDDKPIKKRKPPAPKKRSIPKPKSRKKSEDSEDSE
jgi:hypothetical protein